MSACGRVYKHATQALFSRVDSFQRSCRLPRRPNAMIADSAMTVSNASACKFMGQVSYAAGFPRCVLR
jgi:hypothetical protein